MTCRLFTVLLLSLVATPLLAFAQGDPVTLPATPKQTLGATKAPLEQTPSVEVAPDIYKVADPEVAKAIQELRDLPQPAISKVAPSPVSTIAMPDLNGGYKTPTIGGAFSLINQNGSRVTDADFRNTYMLLMFGYTHCRDDCIPVPAIMQAVNSLPQSQAKRIMPVFVTLDPARDNPAAIRTYLGDYNRRVVGLTGSAAEIDRMAKLYSVNYRVVENPETAIERTLSPQDLAAIRRDPDYRQQSGEPYTIDASPFVYVIGPDGKLATLFNGGLPAENVAKALASGVK